VTFAETERQVLINLVEQLVEIMAERVDEIQNDPLAAMIGITRHDSPPEDEVLLRLLPMHMLIRLKQPSFAALPSRLCGKRKVRMHFSSDPISSTIKNLN
jgi:hypothetical protein